MKLYPALDVDSQSEIVLALVDDFSPSAVEPRNEAMRLFFASRGARDAACAALRAAGYRSEPVDVADEDWVHRSQENLKPVTIGRITVAPPWNPTPEPPATGPHPQIVIIIAPSMGFGTGHHETTRLCLEALQAIDLTGASMLDVGTGSGILAIAANRLGATKALGIDNDPDAVYSARENLALNPLASRTAFKKADLTHAPPAVFDLVTANLTGAVLKRAAARLMGTVRSGGTLIISGILAGERDEVRRAFEVAEVVWEGGHGEWAALALKKR
ncbi:MAG: 50S ribosomal protein L11 methyltransferase [Acidobacteria bacterium]|nr:50S ribosomal protein L11 methyltransferase [Acidobacteriota bacterium]